MQQVARYAQNRELRIEVNNYSCNKLHATRKDSIRIAYGFYSQALAGYNKKRDSHHISKRYFPPIDWCLFTSFAHHPTIAPPYSLLSKSFKYQSEPVVL